METVRFKARIKNGVILIAKSSKAKAVDYLDELMANL